ncbi:RDD family protein [Catellatospora sp. TT07R-123]|uniref:RDD family protein n=1 Tax=Catellatospora sp. TT07R-123 TaxID=2733863 RepID=UPI001FD31A1B|nr:RDD family protein [Catellatospora sp. TT07R-123]
MAERGDGTSAQLVSGEAVHLEVRLARAGSRVLALMLDMIVMVFALMIVATVLTLALALAGFGGPSAPIAYVVSSVLVLVVYPAVLMVLTRGRSLGKLAMGLRVVRDDGGPVTLRHALIRALVGTVLEWPGILLPVNWATSLAVLIGSGRSKRLADLAAGTIVIHDRTPQSWGWVPTTPPYLQEWASTLDLTGLDDELALAARHFLSRSRSLREPYRTRLGQALAAEILAVTTPQPPPNTPGWVYLAAIVGERHRRSALRLARNRASHAALWPQLFPQLPTQPTAAPATGAPATLAPAADTSLRAAAPVA